MRKFVCTTVFACATSAVLLGGAMTDRTTVSILGKPDGVGPCSVACEVGASGRGGASGKAQGEHALIPLDGGSVSFVGSPHSGRIASTGVEEGSIQGNFHADNSFTGHLSGDFGQCSGSCTPPD